MARMIEVLDPTVEAPGAQALMAPRLTDLNGKVIGFLHNNKANADILLARIEGLLRQRFKLADVVRVTKRDSGGGKAYPPQLADELAAKCHAIVNGVGD